MFPSFYMDPNPPVYDSTMRILFGQQDEDSNMVYFWQWGAITQQTSVSAISTLVIADVKLHAMFQLVELFALTVYFHLLVPIKNCA